MSILSSIKQTSCNLFPSALYCSEIRVSKPNNLSPDDPATLKDIYDNSLILLYRLLFILYAEARNLLPLEDSQLYAKNYSLRAVVQAIAEDLTDGRMLLSSSAKLCCDLKPRIVLFPSLTTISV